MSNATEAWLDYLSDVRAEVARGGGDPADMDDDAISDDYRAGYSFEITALREIERQDAAKEKGKT